MSSDSAGPERFRHKTRGTEYDLIGTAELQDASGLGVAEGALLAIYRGDDGKLWARRHTEFGDGRFEKLATPPAPDAEIARLREALTQCHTYFVNLSGMTTDDAQDALDLVNAALKEPRDD